MTMDKEETNLRETLSKEHEDDHQMRKSFRGVIDETEEEIMVSFASLVLKSDEMLRMTMDGSSKFGEDFADDISSCYEDFEDDNGPERVFDQPSRMPRFEPPVIEHIAPRVCYATPSGMASPPPTNTSVIVPSSPAAKKESAKSPVELPENSKPKRPLSAYNLFFQLERERLIAGVDPEEPFSAEDVKRIAIQRRELEQNPDRPKRKHRKSHGKISFAELARKIADKWKSLKPEAKDLLQERAALEKTRYLRELEEWTKYNNTSSDGIYSPQAAKNNNKANELMSPCPSTTAPSTPNYMTYIPSTPSRHHEDGHVFQHHYQGSAMMQQYPPQGSAFHGHRHSPPQHQLQMMYHHDHFSTPYRTQGGYHHHPSENYHPQQQHYQQRPTLVSPSGSFDSLYDEPQNLPSETSAFQYGWSSHAMMRREHNVLSSESELANINIDDEVNDDDVPRGVLDEVCFTPI